MPTCTYDPALPYESMCVRMSGNNFTNTRYIIMYVNGGGSPDGNTMHRKTRLCIHTCTLYYTQGKRRPFGFRNVSEPPPSKLTMSLQVSAGINLTCVAERGLEVPKTEYGLVNKCLGVWIASGNITAPKCTSLTHY